MHAFPELQYMLTKKGLPNHQEQITTHVKSLTF